MELVKDLGKRPTVEGRSRRWGLFLCPYCNKETERRLDTGRNVQSCGCARYDIRIKAATKHNGCGTRLYSIWQNMKSRCYFPGNSAVKHTNWKNLSK